MGSVHDVEFVKDASHSMLQDQDEARLAALGKQQVLKRNFNIWSLLFMCFCTSVTWEAMTSVMSQALLSGGSSSMVWGFLASAIGGLLIALCLSEFASIIPTAGGQYHYVAELSPPKYRKIFSWFAGWITIWGWLLSSMAGIFAISMQLQAYVILFSPDYVYERWHTSLILIAQATLFTLISIFAVKSIHYASFLAIAAHIIGYIATIVYLLVKVNPKNSAKYIFTDLTITTGWNNEGIAWSIGLLSGALGFVGWDSSSHMAEEMKFASRDLPRTMWGSVAISGLLTFPWVIALMACITDLPSVLGGPAGTMNALVQLIYNISGGNRATTVGMTIFFPIISFTTSGPAVVSATSRVIWSFARDGGLPSIFAKVDSRFDVPIYSILLTWLGICALSLIYIGNATAFFGLASGCTVVFIVSYAMPILVNLIWGIDHNKLKRGPFTLGRYSKPIGVAALAWSTYIIIFLCFPIYLPVTPENMNYACLVLGFGFFVPAVTWFAYGRKTYLGIVSEVDATLMETFQAEILKHD